MSESKIIIAMDDDLETEKINNILSSNYYHTLPLPLSGKNNSTQTDVDFEHFNSVDFDCINSGSANLALIDEVLINKPDMENVLEKINKKNPMSVVCVTSDSCSAVIDSGIAKNTLCLPRPFNSRELLLTVEMAFYKMKMKNALSESEDKYRLLIENADDPIAIINYDGQFLMANHSAALFYGYKKEEFLSKTMWDVFPQKKADSHMKTIQTVIKTGKGQIIEKDTSINGKKYYFSTNIQPLPGKNGEVGKAQLITRDITPLKMAESALKKSEKKFREVFNKANDGISLHLVDENGMPGNFTEVNDVVCRRLGYTKDELLQMSPKDVLNEDSKNNIPEIMEELATKGKATFESILITKNGSTLVTEISNHFFYLEGKKMIMSITRDISKRKQNEDELLRILAGIEGTGDSIGISMPDGSHFYQNRSFSELFGYTVEELNKPLQILTLFADQKLGNHIFKKIMAGNDWDGELDMVNKSGNVFPVLLRANSIKNKEGNVIGLSGVLNDITERKKLEKILKTSERRFRNLAETAIDAIIIVDIDEKIIFCNHSLERIFEYREEEILGEYLDTLIPKHYIEDFQTKLDYYNQHELEPGNIIETYGMRKDGSEFPLEMSLNTLKTDDDIFTTFIIRDITRRKLNEFKLKMREDIFKLMSQNIDEAFWLIDPLTGQILYMSPSYYKIWGQSIENLYQNPRSWIESIHPHDKDKFVSHIFGKNEKTSQKREAIECRVIRPDDQEVLIRVRAFPVINQNKEIFRRVGIATDITSTRI
jgi:PAS domain S-box-containing protein